MISSNYFKSATRKYTRKVLLFILSFSMCLLLGCAVHLTKPLSKHVNANKNKAYIYGKFRALNQSQNKIAFKVQEASLVGNVYYIPFEFPPNFFALEVDPGLYTIGKIAFLTNNHTRYTEMSLSEDVSDADFLLEAGKIYYLGDYIGYAHMENKPRARHYEWQLREVDNNFKSTTSKIKKLYSPFRGFEVVNLLDKMKEDIFDRKIQDSKLEGAHDIPDKSGLGRSLPPI